VVELLKAYGVPLKGKRAVVVGRSVIVGKPVALLLLDEDATVTVCHSKTENLADIARQADVLVAAVGIPRFITADMVKVGAAVVDVGIHPLADGTLCGDVA
jgi:methylenetetrahydrofolate dehydrogenase (NADP+)/methenyltetrahydrofolate cyclohydrolase